MLNDPVLIRLVLHRVAKKYNQHSLHYRQEKQEQDIPNDREKNFLLRDNGKSGNNFPSNVLQDDYADKLLISVPHHHLFFADHTLYFPALYLFQFLPQEHKIYYHASQQQYN